MSIVVTFVGPDRTGIVDQISKVVAHHGGNWQRSHMARLAGRFAGILEVGAPEEHRQALVAALRELDLQLFVDLGSTEGPRARQELGLQLTGADRAGIVAQVSAVLARLGVNIESMETRVVDAPMSGGQLFLAEASLSVVPGADLQEVQQALEALADDLVVDITVTEAP